MMHADTLRRLRDGVGLLGLSFPIVILTLLLGYGPALAGTLLGCYVVAFVAVGARWGWGRSFALGVGLFGFGLVWLLVRAGLGGMPLVTQVAVAHGLVLVGLVRFERPQLIAFTVGWLLPAAVVWAGLR